MKVHVAILGDGDLAARLHEHVLIALDGEDLLVNLCALVKRAEEGLPTCTCPQKQGG